MYPTTSYSRGVVYSVLSGISEQLRRRPTKNERTTPLKAGSASGVPLALRMFISDGSSNIKRPAARLPDFPLKNQLN